MYTIKQFQQETKVYKKDKFRLPTVRILYVNVLLLLLVFQQTLLVTAHSKNHQNMAVTEQFTQGLEKFGIKLFSELAKANRQKNIVFSPFSIQTCIAMARMGAEGQTAAQIDQGLGLTSSDLDAIADSYHNVLAVYENSNILKIANKIYVMKSYEVEDQFNELLSKKFFSAADQIDFAASGQAANTMNTWVESKTNNLIKNLISPDMLNSDTRLVLLNAIHFKGEWVHKFPEHATRDADFYLDDTNSVKVKMMHISERFRYGEFPELDATALEMPYKDSDLSMLIILPNKRTGLADLEEKLKTVSLQDLSKKMYSTKVIVDMPKFKAEFDVLLNEPLQKLGMSRMFSTNAEFGKMLKSDEPLMVSKVVHKAFIEVNEAGTEAAAATGMAIRKKRAIFDMNEPKEFIIEHKFMYQIMHKASSFSTSSPSPPSDMSESSSTSAMSNSSNDSIALFMGTIEHIEQFTKDSRDKDEL